MTKGRRGGKKTSWPGEKGEEGCGRWGDSPQDKSRGGEKEEGEEESLFACMVGSLVCSPLVVVLCLAKTDHKKGCCGECSSTNTSKKIEVSLDAQKLETFPHKRRKRNPSGRRCQIEAVTCCCFASSSLVVSESQTFHLIFSAVKLGGVCGGKRSVSTGLGLARAKLIPLKSWSVCPDTTVSFPLLLVSLSLFAFN